MPFFSFTLNDNINLLNYFNIKTNQTYYSKNTYIWKTINKEKNKHNFLINREKRQKFEKGANTVLFCLPPSIGLGDAVEYAKGIKFIFEKNIFLKIGIAFTDSYSFLFQKYFNLNVIYPYIISEDEINQYDSFFHFTLEIEALKNQKYIRSNIEIEIKKYFNINDNENFILDLNKKSRVNKISIFPISNSPIRTMPIFILKNLIFYLQKFYEIEIYLDRNSQISNLLLNDITDQNVFIVDKTNKEELVKSIKNIEYGIFMDSGPLHIAKLFNKKGILIESTVSSENLLYNYSNIKPILNNFSSSYCDAPCGLTDLFNYNKKTGCYNTLKINKKNIIKDNLLSFFSRRGVKNNYPFFIEKPVPCLKSLNVQNIINYIRRDLSL